MARTLGKGNGSAGLRTISSPETWNTSYYHSLTSGTSGSTTVTLGSAYSGSNGDWVYLHQTRGTNHGRDQTTRVVSGAGTTTLTLEHTLDYTFSTSGANVAQLITVPQYSGLAINSTLTVPAFDGTKYGIWRACISGSVTGSGTIDLKGKGFRGGAAVSGVVGSTGQTGRQGEGSTAAGGTQSNAANGSGGGGGGQSGDSGSGGASGGNYNTGENGANNIALAGTASSNADLTIIDLGGGGGSGGGESNDNLGPHNSGKGGEGGGILVVDFGTWSHTGTIDFRGNAGDQGGTSDDGSGSGGSGAPGCGLFRGTTATASSSITAALTAGTGAISRAVNAGAASKEGRIRFEVCSLSGNSNPNNAATIGGYNYCSVLGGMI